MAEVSFYLLAATGAAARYSYACKLIEKAYRQGVFCYVLTESDSQSQWLDELLWTFRPNSFIPHEVYRGMLPEFANTVLIGTLPAPIGWQKVIVNLSHYIPAELGSVERVLEVLDNAEPLRQQGRERYRYYQQMTGVKPQTFNITG